MTTTGTTFTMNAIKLTRLDLAGKPTAERLPPRLPWCSAWRLRDGQWSRDYMLTVHKSDDGLWQERMTWAGPKVPDGGTITIPFMPDQTIEGLREMSRAQNVVVKVIGGRGVSCLVVDNRE